jgi:hypothetical protein
MVCWQYQVLEPVASKLTAEIAADEATPADPNIMAMERNRLASMTFELSGSSGATFRIRLKVSLQHSQHAASCLQELIQSLRRSTDIARMHPKADLDGKQTYAL